MKFRLPLFLLGLVLFANCSDDDNQTTTTETIKGYWRISSITPPVESNPAHPSCLMLNDQLIFSGNVMIWSYPTPDSEGTYNQPCLHNSQTLYTYKANGSTFKIYDKKTGEDTTWEGSYTTASVTIKRGNTVTVYGPDEDAPE